MTGEAFGLPLPSGPGSGGALALLHVRHELAAAASGGTATAGTWNIRTLNVVKTNEITGASLASNLINLPAGTYELDASAPATMVNHHKLRLYDVTGAVTLLSGTTEYAGDTGSVQNRSHLRGRFALAVTSNVRLEHYTQLGRATNGLGAANGINDGTVEVYADVMIRRVS